jgi:hypothetical protein
MVSCVICVFAGNKQESNELKRDKRDYDKQMEEEENASVKESELLYWGDSETRMTLSMMKLMVERDVRVTLLI